MAQTIVADLLYATHKSDKTTTEHYRQMLKEAGRYCFDKPVEVREVNGKLVIIDGLHKADACWFEGIAVEVIYVGENELLTDEDIRSGTLYHISQV
jgi:hypothetical protein